MKVIAIEEHFTTPAIRDATATGAPPPPNLVAALERLPDLGDARLADMDAAGIDMQVLSVSAPGTQELPVEDSVRLARAANDRLAEAVAAHPDRFAGFATLPTPDPATAADELERSVRDLGFKGALINGHTGGVFLDDDRFSPILERAADLGVPIYLHPTFPPPAVMEAYYGGLPIPTAMALATSAWGWHVETGMHALRLVAAGVFDRYPDLQCIVGHMGENLPFSFARIDERLTPAAPHLRRSVGEYLLENFWYTTSGYFTLPPLLCALLVVGADRIIFSVDYPFSENLDGRQFLDHAPLSPSDREKIAHGNVERLLGLPPG